ncbi:hypothetical protein [Peribacillus muralis]|uniref:hypothetical protein n=1 Tax=Peribacillus muralis TaxID=264697 RepID=UPI00366ACDCD
MTNKETYFKLVEQALAKQDEIKVLLKEWDRIIWDYNDEAVEENERKTMELREDISKIKEKLFTIRKDLTREELSAWKKEHYKLRGIDK